VRQRQLLATSIPVVGCGDVSLGTAADRGVDVRDVERALHEALTFGFRLVDVSAEPDAERLCGEAIRTLRLRDVVMLATRVPLVAPLPGQPRRDVLPERLPARYVQERIEASLRTSRLDALSVVQLPLRTEWLASSAWPELAGLCARLVREGKVHGYAAALDDDADLGALDAEPWFDAIAIELSICARRPTLTDQGGKRPILARRPLAGGALAGKLGPGVKLTHRDDRRSLDEPTLERIATLVATLSPLVERVPPAARSCEAAKAALERGRRPDHVEALTLAELALRFVCDRAIALPRLHDRQHLADAVTAANAPPLSQAVRDRIDEVLTNFESL
jgi:aryl-alcohol dehydrogenase-like predicted oxidoreductase